MEKDGVKVLSRCCSLLDFHIHCFHKRGVLCYVQVVFVKNQQYSYHLGKVLQNMDWKYRGEIHMFSFHSSPGPRLARKDVKSLKKKGSCLETRNPHVIHVTGKAQDIGTKYNTLSW